MQAHEFEDEHHEPETISPSVSSSDCIFATLAYFTVIAAILFLVLGSFKKRPYIRFHSLQSILLVFCFIVTLAALFLAQSAGQLIVLLLAALTISFFGIIWIALMIEAWMGKSFRLPLVGALAARQAVR